jgi:hypothetical protein
MPAPEDEKNAHGPLWPPLLLTLGVWIFALAERRSPLALTALVMLGLVPTVWRVLKRRWVRGDVLRGLGMGFIASHAPLLLGACSTLDRPECRIHLCMDGVLAGAPFIPWAGLVGTLLYWGWARPVTPP